MKEDYQKCSSGVESLSPPPTIYVNVCMFLLNGINFFLNQFESGIKNPNESDFNYFKDVIKVYENWRDNPSPEHKDSLLQTANIMAQYILAEHMDYNDLNDLVPSQLKTVLLVEWLQPASLPSLLTLCLRAQHATTPGISITLH